MITRRRILGLPLLGLPLLAWPALSMAQTPFLDGGQKKAFDLYRAAASGSTSAFEDLRSRANDGDRWCAMQFGFLHHIGRAPGVGTDINVAMKAYRKAARLGGDSTAITGNAIAAHNMGVIYLYGADGVEVNATEAARWFVAGAGDEMRVFVPSAMNLANLYEYGFGGIAQDLPESFRWYRAAAARKEPYATYKLGAMLVSGIGTPANQFEGRIKLNAAAEMWSRDAMYTLAQLASADRGLMEKNPVVAAKWLLVAADGDARYKKVAQDAMAKLPADKQAAAKNAARGWIKSHPRTPPQVDYRLPLNIDTKFD